jgi:uncharacterized membrane protein YhaH (DUF805 family)
MSASTKNKQVSFFEAVKRAFQRYSEFEGTSTRPEFWWYALFVVLALAICSTLNFAELSEGVTLGSVLGSVFSLATLLPTLAIGVRRFRDAGEGWGNIFWLFLPVAGVVIAAIYWAKPSKN